jgi:hypothetical protein
MECYPLLVCLASKQPTSLYKYGITHDDIVYLAGPNSPYKRYGTKRRPEASMSLHSAALALSFAAEEILDDYDNEVLLGVWWFVTGYELYVDVLRNMSEHRILTESGLHGDDPTPENEEAYEELMRRTNGGYGIFQP